MEVLHHLAALGWMWHLLPGAIRSAAVESAVLVRPVAHELVLSAALGYLALLVIAEVWLWVAL
jgi:hypothetical protein